MPLSCANGPHYIRTMQSSKHLSSLSHDHPMNFFPIPLSKSQINSLCLDMLPLITCPHIKSHELWMDTQSSPLYTHVTHIYNYPLPPGSNTSYIVIPQKCETLQPNEDFISTTCQTFEAISSVPKNLSWTHHNSA